MKNKKIKPFFITLIVVFVVGLIGIGINGSSVEQSTKSNEIITEKSNEIANIIEIDKKLPETGKDTENEVKDYSELKQEFLANIPDYSNTPYVAINNNKPFFNDVDLTTTSYERYSNLDILGRCGIAIANIGKDIMPTEERGNIGSVKPTGWHSVRYKGVDGNYLYNRCHLIGYQLTAENANEKNLITGTRYMNVEGMLPFENMVADYVKETGNHVLYRVTPIFKGNNLLASGVLMEAKSVEDNGKGILFNVYCYNVQPGIKIDYEAGESSGPEYTGTTSSNTSSSSSKNTSSSNNTSSGSNSTSKGTATVNNTKSQTYILNINTKKFHEPSCGSAARIKDSNKSTFKGTRDELISKGYSPCGNCDP